MKDTKDMLEEHGERRRAFVTKSVKVAAAAPAIALLLSQTSIPAHAGISGSQPPGETTTMMPTTTAE
jgi:hypothetical protein